MLAAKKTITVARKRMAFIEAGEGERVLLFLHGNPTSSYLWRNVLPEVAGIGRCIAPDLIGMGDSEKLPYRGPETYRFGAHREAVRDFIDTVIGAHRSVVLVGHDWGSALAFDWARHHPERTAGLVYMEAIVRPLAWSEWPEASRRMFHGFRSEAGEEMILDRNLFVERVLPAAVLRHLEPAEMSEYRRPFLKRQDRWPVLTWPRLIPLDGEPANIVALVSDYAAWMAQNDIPKLFVNAEPGGILTGAQREFCRTWRNQREVTVRGSHFIQEDSGPEIGRAIADWVADLPPRA